MHESILVIDDEKAIANLTAMWIQQAGYTPLVAYGGHSGLEATAAHHPNLILLDIRMPDLDGFEVNRRLKSTPGLADIPVIFLSAHAQESARQEALTAGAAHFLSKPCECKDLIGTTRAALAQSVRDRQRCLMQW